MHHFLVHPILGLSDVVYFMSVPPLLFRCWMMAVI